MGCGNSKNVVPQKGVKVPNMNCCVAACVVDPTHPWVEGVIYEIVVSRMFGHKAKWNDLTLNQKQAVHDEVNRMRRANEFT